MEADINAKNLRVLRFLFRYYVELPDYTRQLLNCIVAGQQEFCLSLLDGTLPPYHKSEPVPQEVSFIYLLKSFKVYVVERLNS